MSHHALKILRFRSLSSLSVSVVVLWLFSCLDERTLWLKFESPCIPESSMHDGSVASDLFDISLHFISFLIFSLITLSLLPVNFFFQDVVD